MKSLDKTLWPDSMHKSWITKDAFNKKLVSVIIPTYNRKTFVLEAVESVWNQMYRPIELIIVDDGSIDNTKESIHEWLEEKRANPDFELRYVWQNNSGVSSARNHGLIVSNGAFIQFLDSDDILLPQRISLCMEAFSADENIELVHSAFIFEYSKDSLEYRGQDHVVAGPSIMQDPPSALDNILTAAGLYRRGILAEAGPWNESLQICEDSEYFSRVLSVVERAIGISDALFIKRKHGGPRLLDLQKQKQGLESKARYLSLREKTIVACGYNRDVMIGGWFLITQDALALGDISVARKALEYAKSMRKGFYNLFAWYFLWFIAHTPKGISSKFFTYFLRARNTIRWYWHKIWGKIRPLSDNKGS